MAFLFVRITLHSPVPVVHQEVRPEGESGEVVYAARPKGDVAQDEHVLYA